MRTAQIITSKTNNTNSVYKFVGLKTLSLVKIAILLVKYAMVNNKTNVLHAKIHIFIIKIKMNVLNVKRINTYFLVFVKTAMVVMRKICNIFM